MAFRCGFFNSLNGDRKYDAVDMSKIFDGVIADGVFATVGNAFAARANGTNMTVNVDTGKFWFNHVWGINDALYPLIHETADILGRIDTGIIEVDNSLDVRNAVFKVVKGVPSATPTKPVLTKTEELNQYPLYYATIAANATSITQANIENAVGTSETPFVTGLIDTVNVDSLLLQWEGEFLEWFDHIKGMLSTDQAGNLQMQIDDYLFNAIDLTLTTDKWVNNSAPVYFGDKAPSFFYNSGGSNYFKFKGSTASPNILLLPMNTTEGDPEFLNVPTTEEKENFSFLTFAISKIGNDQYYSLDIGADVKPTVNLKIRLVGLKSWWG